MNGDAPRLLRTLLARLALAAACSAVFSMLVFVSGNLGSLSGRALDIAVRGMGFSGLAALALSLAAIVANIVSSRMGVRLSASGIIVAILCALTGAASAVLAGLVGALAGGLAI